MSNLTRSEKLHTAAFCVKTSFGYNILDTQLVVNIPACYFWFIHNSFNFLVQMA
jgi:hypothetical protein